MSRIFGPIRQIGYITTDIETALRHWVEVTGVGPWLVMERQLIPEFCYKGGVYDDFEAKFAWANSGDVQIELIQQRSATPSMIRDYIAANPNLPPEGGVQHWAAWPDRPAEYDAIHARATAAGLTLGHHGRTYRNRFAYFHVTQGGATGIEIADATEDGHAFRASIRDAAKGWDGRDPVRFLRNA